MLITKRNLRTISVLSWIVAKDEEEVEILNAIFDSAFNSKTGCSQGTQTPELDDREQSKLSKRKRSSTCYNTQTHASLWNWIGSIPKLLRELAEVLTELLYIT